MNQVYAIIWKEWRTVVDTPLGYVIATAFLIASGFFFENSLFLMGQAEMRGYFSTLPLLLMFFIPAMSMRMLAEEQRSGTFELLATLPVSTIHLVWGKYLAVMVQICVLLGATLFYPLTLSWLGNVDGGRIAAAFFAAFLLSGSYAAVCIFASALTRNVVVAYVIGFGILLAAFVLQQASSLLSPAMQNVLSIISPVHHYQLMLRGMIGIENVVYLCGISAFFIAAAIFQLERRRWA